MFKLCLGRAFSSLEMSGKLWAAYWFPQTVKANMKSARVRKKTRCGVSGESLKHLIHSSHFSVLLYFLQTDKSICSAVWRTLLAKLLQGNINSGFAGLVCAKVYDSSNPAKEWSVSPFLKGSSDHVFGTDTHVQFSTRLEVLIIDMSSTKKYLWKPREKECVVWGIMIARSRIIWTTTC